MGVLWGEGRNVAADDGTAGDERGEREEARAHEEDGKLVEGAAGGYWGYCTWGRGGRGQRPIHDENRMTEVNERQQRWPTLWETIRIK